MWVFLIGLVVGLAIALTLIALSTRPLTGWKRAQDELIVRVRGMNGTTQTQFTDWLQACPAKKLVLEIPKERDPKEIIKMPVKEAAA